MPVNVMPTLVMKPMRQILTTDGAENSRAASPNPSSHRNPNIVDSTTAAELAAKATMINKRLEGIKSLLSIDLTLRLIQSAKAVIERLGVFIRDSPIPTSKIQDNCQSVFVQLLHTLGERHLKPGFDQAISLLEPDKASEEQSNSDALTGFAEMINVCDLIQQMVDVFYEEELCSKQLSDRNSFTDSASKEKKAFEQSLDEWVASGLNRGLEAILNRIQAALTTKQLITDYDPEAAIYDVAKLKTPAARAKANQRESMQLDFATTPTAATNDVCEVLSTPVQSLRGAIDASILDVFYTELGLRLFGALRKHILRMRISTRGATQLMIDMAAYYEFVDKTLARSIKNQASSKDICLYFESLRRVAEIYLVSGDAKLLIPMVTDQDRWKGIFDREEILEFISRRADWLTIRKSVEKGLDGTECTIM